MIKKIVLLIIFLLETSFSLANVSVMDVETLLNNSQRTATVNKEDLSVQQPVNTNQYAIVFFYMSSCIHCRRFDPILKSEAEKYQLPIYPFTLDGATLPDFLRSETPPKEFLSLFFPAGKSITVPTVFLVNTKTMKAYHVSTGELSAPEFENRLQELTQHIQAGSA